MNTNELIQNLIDNKYILMILITIFLNFFTAIMVAIYKGDFTLARLPDVFTNKVIPMFATYITSDIIGRLTIGDGLPSIVFVAIELKLVSDILFNLESIPAFRPHIEGLPSFLKKVVDELDKIDD